MPAGPPGSSDDAPLNLSMKTEGIKAVKIGEKRDHKDSQLGSLGLGRGVSPLDFPPGLGGGLGSMLTPSLEVLQSLYGAQPGESRNVLASMQEALQRQLLGADGKRDEKKKRMEDVQERSRHLGRGTSKPKKNTVASLLEQCRAAGIKPSSLPLPPTTSIVVTSATTSPPLHGMASSRPGDSLSITTSPIFNSSPSPSPASQSLPPTLLPGLPLGLSSASSSSYPSSVGSPAPPTPIPTPPVPSLSISTVVTSLSSSSSAPPSPLPAGEPITTTTTATTTTTTVSSSTTTTTTTPSSVTAPPSPPPSSTPTPTTTTSTTIPPPQPASPPSTPASVTASPPPSQATPTSVPLPVSLPPSLSLSSSVSITSVTPEAAITSTPSKPSVTIHPTTSTSETTPDQEFDKMDNSVDILEVSQAFPHQNGGDKPVKKRHMITSSSVDGRLITTIKAAAATGVPEDSELSDSDSDEESTSLSSVDDDALNHVPSPWLKRDTPDSASVYSESPPVKKRKMITDEVSLRVPLMYGWRRETTMRTITQSGVRGEVVYYAPCGKPFRQYPDIMRYLEKNGITEVTRDNFSFSSKIPIGEYVESGTQVRHSENDIRDKIKQIREQKGYKPQRKHEDGRDALEIEAEAILRRLEAEEEAEKARKDLMSQLEEQHQLRLQKEQERIRKQDELRREKEELRRQREEENRQRLYEQLRKAQEREQEKQKQKILKEQLYLQELNKQREMLYTLELERERRRYHGVLVRALEGRKRHEERERRREEMKEEKRATRERKREERLQARELNQLMKEVKEDMELTDHTPLPDAPRLQGLRLPPEAFGNILMVFEFLHNFGETLGFDMESLPSIQSLQMALLNDTESEEELLSVLSHLLVCAIEDPGIPSAHRHTTILGQTLNRADITHANISEILRVYLNANAMGEVRIIYGLLGTEKERRENPKKGQEWDARLAEMDAYKMSQWLLVMPFLALNPTQKSEIVAYVCNELLQNKAVVRQIEDSLDRHNGLKTEKWKLDTRIRKLRMSVARKRIYNAAMRSMMEHRGGEDSNMSSVSSCHGGEQDKADAKKDKEEDKLEEDEEDDDNESGNDSDNIEEIPDEEDDKRLNADDASKTLDLLQRQMNQVRQDLFETAQQVRGFNCGQDRYQRTMWVLPHAGGPFLEGLSSCDYTGREHFPLNLPTSAAKVGLTQEELEARLAAAREEKERKLKEEEEAKKEVKEEPEVKEEKVEVKTEVEVKSEKEEEAKEGEALDMKPSVPLLQVKKEEELKEEEDCDVPEIPHKNDRKSESAAREEGRGQNGVLESKETMGNTIAELYPPMLGANLSPYLVNGLKEAPPPPPNAGEGIDPNLLALGLGLVPGQYLRPEHVAQREKLSFSLLPRMPCDVSTMESLPSGQTPQGTPRGSPREASPCSRYNGPHSPLPGTLHAPSGTPGLTATPVSTINTPLAVSTPRPPATAPGGGPATPNTAANTPDVSVRQEVPGTPDVTATPDQTSNTTANTTTDPTSATDLTNNTTTLGTPAAAATSTPGGPTSAVPPEGAGTNPAGGIQSLPHKELLERLHQTAEALPIPGEYKTGWWHLGDMEQLKKMIGALNERGVRERELKRFIEKNFSIVKNAISKRSSKSKLALVAPIDTEATNLDTDPEEAAKVMYDEFGTPVADEPQHWLPDVALKVDFAVLESVYAMEEKITNASMQSKSWRLNDNGERHMGEFRASCLEPVEEDDSRLNPIHVGRDRLLALEEGIERRYLKPPLGVLMNPKSDTAPDTKEVPKGLLVWREAVGKTETAAQLAMCTYMLETAVAWDKSIMKAYCQFCHSGDHEEKLLLCDGCDKGYHTHCFKPPMNNIPDGDWYCYECVNKFSDTSQRHCLVCGGTEGRTLVYCSVCPRAYHTTCITPNLNKVPRNKWVCPACTSKSPRGRRGRAKKVSESNNTSSAAAQPADTTTDSVDDSQAVSPAVTKKDRAIKKKDQKDLVACRSITAELEVHEDAWPFLLPVNTRQFPTYKKIIRRPMDLSVIKKKLEDNLYKSREEYCEDLRLMFNNCETFNEDDSPVGKAGHNLRSFFETRWNEHFPPS
ncbi:bromodomain adjacent to zinc finger domain protein 2B-like isoform X2 [Scylla paramamosain]|uniref:bromodomain adjacent to zinc finger domain protein 2B-like isoform X2 n=1 Tax=Scylla paramamosain TaxID=85552 RepID=UPI003083464D